MGNRVRTWINHGVKRNSVSNTICVSGQFDTGRTGNPIRWRLPYLIVSYPTSGPIHLNVQHIKNRKMVVLGVAHNKYESACCHIQLDVVIEDMTLINHVARSALVIHQATSQVVQRKMRHCTPRSCRDAFTIETCCHRDLQINIGAVSCFLTRQRPASTF